MTELQQSPGGDSDLPARQETAKRWFEELRDQICESFEALEDALPDGAPLADQPAGRFVRTPGNRTAHSGTPGVGGVMRTSRGRACETGGVVVERLGDVLGCRWGRGGW